MRGKKILNEKEKKFTQFIKKLKPKNKNKYYYVEVDLEKVRELYANNKLFDASFNPYKGENPSDNELIEAIEVYAGMYNKNKFKDIHETGMRDFSARITNKKGIKELLPSEIRVSDLDQYRILKGKVIRVESIQPICNAAKFECPACGQVLNVLQLSIKFKEPTRCSCGRKGKFRLLKKNEVDSQTIFLELNNHEVFAIFLERDLTVNKIKEGDVIEFVGLIRSAPLIFNRSESRIGKFQAYVNNILKVQK